MSSHVLVKVNISTPKRVKEKTIDVYFPATIINDIKEQITKMKNDFVMPKGIILWKNHMPKEVWPRARSGLNIEILGFPVHVVVYKRCEVF